MVPQGAGMMNADFVAFSSTAALSHPSVGAVGCDEGRSGRKKEEKQGKDGSH